MKKIIKNNQHAVNFLQKQSFVEIKYMTRSCDLIPMNIYGGFITEGLYV